MRFHCTYILFNSELLMPIMEMLFHFNVIHIKCIYLVFRSDIFCCLFVTGFILLYNTYVHCTGYTDIFNFFTFLYNDIIYFL